MTSRQISKMNTTELKSTIEEYEMWGMDPVVVAKMRTELEYREEDELSEYSDEDYNW